MILVNFGGPRESSEIASFLTELLSDQEVIRTWWPRWFHRWFFTRIARKRAEKIAPDYALIGGGSPIYQDTEETARLLREKLGMEIFVFHRYLVSTHALFFERVEQYEGESLRVLPCFPQFSYATTGSVAKLFSEQLSKKTQRSLAWIKSYPTHPKFIGCYQKRILDCLQKHKIELRETALLFSCHGLPQVFIDTGDCYETECNQSFVAISNLFPEALCKLSYQSKFGRGKWLQPATEEMCQTVLDWIGARRSILVVPLSFTSDHIETLYEIEEIYLPILRKPGLTAFRCPALNVEPDWIDALAEIVGVPSTLSNERLVRK